MNKTRKLNGKWNMACLLTTDWDFAYVLMRFFFKALAKFWDRPWYEEEVSIEDQSHLPPQIRVKLPSGTEYIIFIRKAVPDFKSEAEESDFWSEHDLSEFYWEPADDIVLAIEPVEQNCEEAK